MTSALPPRLLEGRVAVVTGAAQGIGRAVAAAYVAAGAKVALTDVAAEAVTATAASIGGDVLALPLDVTEAEATEAAADRIAAALGVPDIVVANAGILALHLAVDTPLATWRRVLEVNLTGAFLTATVFARRLRGRPQGGAGGRILFTASLFGRRGGKENAAYSASKFGMVGLMECMAAELAAEGIQVNAVCPGQMDTAMIRQLFAERAQLRGVAPEAVQGALEAKIPMARLGGLDELAGTYVWLASGLSGYVTGQSITVDGGWQVG